MRAGESAAGRWRTTSRDQRRTRDLSRLPAPDLTSTAGPVLRTWIGVRLHRAPEQIRWKGWELRFLFARSHRRCGRSKGNVDCPQKGTGCPNLRTLRLLASLGDDIILWNIAAGASAAENFDQGQQSCDGYFCWRRHSGWWRAATTIIPCSPLSVPSRSPR